MEMKYSESLLYNTTPSINSIKKLIVIENVLYTVSVSCIVVS